MSENTIWIENKKLAKDQKVQKGQSSYLTKHTGLSLNSD